MDDRIAISRLKQGDLSGLESLVNRYQAQAAACPYTDKSFIISPDRSSGRSVE